MKAGNGHHVDLEQFLEDIKAVVRDGEELLKAGVSTVKERAIAGAHTTDQAMREHPYQAIGIMFGLGLLAGVVVSSLLSREPAEEED